MRTAIGYRNLVILLGFITILMGCAGEKPVSQASPPGSTVVIKQSGGAGLLIAECADKQYISNIADYIIEGTVERVESNWNQDKSAILTHTDLSIERYVKGAPFARNELHIVTPGGTVGDITQAVEDQPIFHTGKRVRIYFYQETDGEYYIICAQSGVEELGLLESFLSP